MVRIAFDQVNLIKDVTRQALYALMVGAAITGLLAWYGDITSLAEVHEPAKPALIILIHVAAVFYHQFRIKDGLMDRMRKPQN